MLLLHYEDIQALLHRNEVMRRLKQHIVDYEKGAIDVFAITGNHLEIATQRARALATRFNAHTDPNPFTAIAELVTLLRDTAAGADLRRYKKASRGPKKPPVKRSNDPAQPTVSTARLLAARKGKKAP